MDIQEIGSKFEDLLLANPDFDESLLEKDEDGCYEDSDINSMYQMFEAGIEAAEFKEIRAAKAQAVPEGFILMPKVPTERMVNATRGKHEGAPYLPYSIYEAFVEQAMIEALEQK